LFLTFLDTTIVSVTLADVQSDLHAGVSQLQWVVNGYALVFASLMLMAGALSDRFGRKRLLLIGLGIFAAGSLIAALAPDPATLIAGRAVMGTGAAASEPGTLSILRHLYPERRTRARALGAWAAVSGLALATGPVLGGVLVGVGSWRSVFWFNLAAGFVLVVAAQRTLPESADPSGRHLDLGGFLLGGVSIASLTFAIIVGETTGYAYPPVVVLFAAGGVCALGFLLAERAAAAPMLDLRYFRSPPFSGALAVAFALFFGIFSIFFFAALYLQVVVGYSAYRIAVEFLPMAVAMIVASVLAGRWVSMAGPRIPMASGVAFAGAGVLLSDLVLSSSKPSLWLVATLAMAGIGFGTSVVPVTSVALGVVPPQRSGMAASATNTSRELGAVFGVAVLGALVNGHLSHDLALRLHALGIPSAFNAIVIGAIETGGVSSSSAEAKRASKVYGSIVDKVIHAAYGAFHSGLEVALLAAGVAILAASVIAVGTLGPGSGPASGPDGGRAA
jgi:EmrB/QacA subfamily drug resistance transporter